MLNKKTCQLCHQKHEKKWDEEGWKEGFVDCPHELIGIEYNGKKLYCKNKEAMLLKYLYGMHKIDEEVPAWCEFKH